MMRQQSGSGSPAQEVQGMDNTSNWAVAGDARESYYADGAPLTTTGPSHLSAYPSVAVPGGVVFTAQEGSNESVAVWLTRDKARALRNYLNQFLDTTNPDTAER
jgi:hypothetical protein